MIYLLSLAYAEYTAKSANVGFPPVVQLFIPPTNPANAPRAENPFINSEKILWVSTMCAQILGFSSV